MFFFIFTHTWGNDLQRTCATFQMGWKHQLDQTSSESINFYRQSHRYLPGASIIPVLLQPMSRLEACVPCQPDVCVVIGLGHCVQWVCLTFGTTYIIGRNILENITNPWIITGWWFQRFFFIFTPKIGEDSQIDEHIFQRGWNHQLDYIYTWYM